MHSSIFTLPYYFLDLHSYEFWIMLYIWNESSREMETSKGVEEGGVVAKSFSSMDFSLTVDGESSDVVSRHLQHAWKCIGRDRNLCIFFRKIRNGKWYKVKFLILKNICLRIGRYNLDIFSNSMLSDFWTKVARRIQTRTMEW